MKIPENHNYRVSIPLKQNDIFNIQGAVEEIQLLCEWLDELVDWHPDMYSMNVRSQSRIVDVWFLEERHALLCTLRWI